MFCFYQRQTQFFNCVDTFTHFFSVMSTFTKQTNVGINTSLASGRRLCHTRGNAKGRFARALDVGAGIGAATQRPDAKTD